MNSRQRAYLKGLAMGYEPVFNIGKNSLTDEVIGAVKEALEGREAPPAGRLRHRGHAGACHPRARHGHGAAGVLHLETG